MRMSGRITASAGLIVIEAVVGLACAIGGVAVGGNQGRNMVFVGLVFILIAASKANEAGRNDSLASGPSVVNVLAAEPRTFADDWPQILILGCIFAFLVGFLIRRARARARAENQERTERLAVLPEEFRPRLHNPGLVVAAVAATLAAAGVGGLIGGWVGACLPAVVVTPFLVVLFRQQNARIRGIAESVRTLAPTMDEEELAAIIGALEEAYGAETMGSLRDLLPPNRVG
jgi:hypothetical protein